MFYCPLAKWVMGAYHAFVFSSMAPGRSLGLGGLLFYCAYFAHAFVDYIVVMYAFPCLSRALFLRRCCVSAYVLWLCVCMRVFSPLVHARPFRAWLTVVFPRRFDTRSLHDDRASVDTYIFFYYQRFINM